MDYEKKYLEYKIKYITLKNQIKNQTGGYTVDGKTLSFPLFKVGERIDNRFSNDKGSILQVKQVESLVDSNVYENYYDVRYDNGTIETVRENIIAKASAVSKPIIPTLGPSGPFGPSGPSGPYGPFISPATYGPAPYGPGGPYGPVGPTVSYQSPYYVPDVYVPNVYYDKKTSRRSSRKSSRRSSRKSSKRSRK